MNLSSFLVVQIRPDIWMGDKNALQADYHQNSIIADYLLNTSDFIFTYLFTAVEEKWSEDDFR